jgi:hypothetical protein
MSGSLIQESPTERKSREEMNDIEARLEKQQDIQRIESL